MPGDNCRQAPGLLGVRRAGRGPRRWGRGRCGHSRSSSPGS
jgi:hypothetical protein